MLSYRDVLRREKLFIGVSGIIGCGKSTLTKTFSDAFVFEASYEPVAENPYLELFYKDMRKYGCIMQLRLLHERFRLHMAAVFSPKHVIQDRTIYDDMVFATMLRRAGLIEELDFETYRLAFLNMSQFLHRPDVLVYLDCSPEVAMRNIRARGRGAETTITLEYLRDLKANYEEWLEVVGIPVIRVDVNDTFADPHHVMDLIIERLQRSEPVPEKVEPKMVGSK